MLKIFKIEKKSGKPSIGEENSHIFEIVHVFKNGKVDLRHKYMKNWFMEKIKGLFI